MTSRCSSLLYRLCLSALCCISLITTTYAEETPPLLNYDNGQSAIGINIQQINYWNTEWTFTDFFKTAGAWLTQCRWGNNKCVSHGNDSWNSKEQNKLILDENGWIKAFPKKEERDFDYVSAFMFGGSRGKIPAGKYHVLYDGEGSIEYGVPAKYLSSESEPGHDVFELTESALERIEEGGVLVSISETGDKNGNNYLRNIRVIAPGGICDNNPAWYAKEEKACTKLNKSYTPLYKIADKQIFHPLFLQELKPFRAIRYMDFLGTNTNKTSSWDKRPKPGDAVYSGDEGAPFELAIQLSNAANADAWVNIPARADDNFMLQAAKYAKQHLNPNLLIYVELGNEAWNFAWPYNVMGDYYKAKAKAEWGNSIDDYTGQLSWYSKRAGELCDIWRNEFGAQAKSRLKCVVGVQASWTDIAQRTLECPYHQAKTKQACGKKFDVLAVAPYFGGYLARDGQTDILKRWLSTKSAAEIKNNLFLELMGADANGKSPVAPLFAETKSGEKWPPPQYGAMQPIEQWLKDQKKLADHYGLQLVAYEGGSDLTQIPTPAKDDEVTALMIDTARDARMKQVYENYFNTWQKNGGGLFMHFTSIGKYSRWGSYPLKEYQGQPAAAKYDAVVDYIGKHPCWWSGCSRAKSP